MNQYYYVYYTAVYLLNYIIADNYFFASLDLHAVPITFKRRKRNKFVVLRCKNLSQVLSSTVTDNASSHLK